MNLKRLPGRPVARTWCGGGVWVSSIRIQSRPLKRAAPQHAARLWRAIDRLHIAAVRPHSNGGHPDPSDDTSRRDGLRVQKLIIHRKCPGAPVARSLSTLSESGGPMALLKLLHPDPSAECVALEGGRYPSA